jgi:hypothetical protein
VKWLALAVVVAACHDESYLQYNWDDRTVLCSNSVDDLSQEGPWDLVETELELAHDRGTVSLFHAHDPGGTISIAAIERLLGLADQNQLDYVLWREIDPASPHRAGVALAFDDQYIDSWFSIRDVLAAHDAHVTFFLTRFYSRTDEERAKVAQLVADGHDVQAHSVNHLHARDYVRDHGLPAYLADEVLPSIQILRDAGYTPTEFAYPFGESSPEIDTAVLEHVRHVRVSPGSCPY